MYQALYRKWRPQTFDEVIGQEHITETLKSQVRSGRLSHAYLFIGTRGTGKTTCARILAKAVNCENPVDGNPCGQCPACRGIADGSVLDVVELDAASNNGVDNVRALREEAVFSPAAVKKRVYIIDEVHMLSSSAFNALLKILEEPPEHLMFILATTELQKVPATILSRCQRHSFHRIPATRIAEYLGHVARQEGFALTPDAAELIARLAEGGVRDALSLLDQCSAYEEIGVDEVYLAMGLTGNRRIVEMLEHILDHDSSAALSEFAALWMDGKDPATFLKELGGLLRDVLIERVAPQNGTSLITGGYDPAALERFSAAMTKEELIGAMETVQRYTAQLRDAKSPRTVAELCIISLCDDTLGDSVAELRARVSRLEAKLEGTDLSQVSRSINKKSAPAPERPAFPQKDEPDMPPPPEDEYAPPAPEERFAPPVSVGEFKFPVSKPVQAAVVEDIVPAQKETSSPPEEQTAAKRDGFWSAVCEKAAPRLTPDMRAMLNDEAKIRAELDGDVLKVGCAPGFVYKRFNRQDVIQKLTEAARATAGRDVRVMLSEFSADKYAKRDVNELAKWPEVKFM